MSKKHDEKTSKNRDCLKKSPAFISRASKNIFSRKIVTKTTEIWLQKHLKRTYRLALKKYIVCGRDPVHLLTRGPGLSCSPPPPTTHTFRALDVLLRHSTSEIKLTVYNYLGSTNKNVCWAQDIIKGVPSDLPYIMIISTPNLPTKTSPNTFFQRRNRNEELSSMLSFEISHLSSTTSVEEVICRLWH